VTSLALSRHLSFHGSGDAAFVWHGLTGDVAEMSRDVLALLLAFDPAADDQQTAERPPEGLSTEQAQEFIGILRARRFLVRAGSRTVDELSPLLAGYPRVPRGAVFERTAEGIVLYSRRGEALPLDATTSRLFDRCDGEHTLGQVLGDAGPAALPDLLRLARADAAALKILAKPVSQGGVQLNPAAESTMPHPELPDPRAFANGGPAPAPPNEPETTFAELFAAPHPALGGKTFAEALRAEIERRVPGATRIVNLQSGDALPQEADAIVASEIAARLGFAGGKNEGALRLVYDAARALASGGVLLVADYGDPKAEATPHSIRFADLQAAATEAGLSARVVPLAEALGLDGSHQALSTTKASFPALQALFAAHGMNLAKRAWLRSEIEAMADGHLDLKSVHGLQWAPLSERTLGLSPRQFWALIAEKPKPTLH
jgi:hypothetical protein